MEFRKAKKPMLPQL